MPRTPRRVHVIARGRVQGVAYRAHTAETARAAGLTGWVRNQRDGSVEAVLEGPAEAVESALAALRRGPRFARVDALETTEEPVSGLAGFEIRY